MVGHEERVELSALEGLGEALEMREIEVRVRIRPGIAPPAAVWIPTGRMNAPRRSRRSAIESLSVTILTVRTWRELIV